MYEENLEQTHVLGSAFTLFLVWNFEISRSSKLITRKPVSCGAKHHCGSGSKGSASFCRIRIQIRNSFHGSRSRSEPSSPPLPSSPTPHLCFITLYPSPHQLYPSPLLPHTSYLINLPSSLNTVPTPLLPHH